jgi:acyl-CoA reductase-like NAD-dependent aldehyde dehydrogenase
MTHKLVIDGALVDGAGTLDVINPSTGKVFAQCARADVKQLNSAIAAAKAAFPKWAAIGVVERRRMMCAVADAMNGRFNDFARLLTQEQGKPLAQAEYEIGGAIAAIRSFAAMDVPQKVLKSTAVERVIMHHTPLGVIAAITPWNFPMLLLMMKVGPALITGNTVIAKPAATTPLTTLLFGELASTILPPGVLNVIVDANDLGSELTRHPDIAKVAFTGSTATGRRVMESVSSTLKRLTLELGGNDAAIVLDDVNLPEAAVQIFQAAMLNAGQVCLAVKRVYAPTALYDGLCNELARLAREALVDDGFTPGVQIGPIQNKAQYEKVKEFLDDAHAHGKVIAGGKALDREGYFIPPTIVRDIPENSRLVREEQFGPVLPVIAYDDLDEAIALANDSEYGLGGTIWSSNPERAFEVALKIDAGTVWVNKHLDLPFDVPFGGAKQSGFGAENGQEGLEEYTQAKIINMAL